MSDRAHVVLERDQIFASVFSVDGMQRERLILEYAKRSEAAFAPDTRKNYVNIIRGFKRWCAENGYSSDPPIPPLVLASYVDAMGGRIRASTIETRLWAINEMHRAQFLSPPSHHRLVELAMMGVKRRYGAGSRQVPALGKVDVLRAISSLGTSRIEVRDKALLWMATDTWCRASELANFRVRDLLRQDDGSSLLYIARSKTDQFGEGAYAFLSEKGTLAVLEWIELAGLRTDDPIVTKSQKNGQKRPLDGATISRIFKRCTGRTDVSAHSTRVGGVQDALRLGCDMSSIMVAGRWNSPEMPARYGRRLLASQSAAAKVSAAFADFE
ncbi:tyrosine-type recombinase/integrase [Maritimibacter sp. DP1N21-5]|uniref:tyrosine-type recombinase/integrase n=1 Tax=Maritimibacter sp. DP1N21-5 TaxID=2836867 RepID=UPI001C48FA75|nr:tyrosine-type recombinase/integrase [Maritimibacter sp. DP1N21-5]MBV7408169.1 tyrosine-type recombinase/integrase [Maritimibacter sp. DP1N21-5]